MPFADNLVNFCQFDFLRFYYLAVHILLYCIWYVCAAIWRNRE